MERPCRAAFLQPVGIRRRAVEVFIRRITPRGETCERLGRQDSALRFDPAVNLPRNKQIVLIPKSFIDLEPKCRQRDVDTAAGMRQLDRSSRVAKLPAKNLKRIQMLIAPAESDLQSRVQLGQRRLFGDQKPAGDRRRHTAQPGTELYSTHFLLGVHRPTLTPTP